MTCPPKYWEHYSLLLSPFIIAYWFFILDEQCSLRSLFISVSRAFRLIVYFYPFYYCCFGLTVLFFWGIRNFILVPFFSLLVVHQRLLFTLADYGTFMFLPLVYSCLITIYIKQVYSHSDWFVFDSHDIYVTNIKLQNTFYRLTLSRALKRSIMVKKLLLFLHAIIGYLLLAIVFVLCGIPCLIIAMLPARYLQ